MKSTLKEEDIDIYIMAKVKVVGTGSSGNSYILECEDGILLIELGIPWSEIVKSLNYQEGFRKVRGCIASHC